MHIPNRQAPTYTTDWSSQICNTWPTHVIPYLQRQKPLCWLEIGSFEGRSALWTVKNVFLHLASTIVCIDIWDTWVVEGKVYDPKVRAFDYEATFDRNTRGVPGIVKLKGKSSQLLPILQPRHFHGCYIDGSHEEKEVLSDARMALPLMRPGAVMVFDDYERPESDGVKRAVDIWSAEFKSQIEMIHLGYQAIFKVLP
jgi:predicted O-methyltransferase YrrM